AKALRRLFTNIKFGVGPGSDSGFYNDTDNGESPLTAEDLPAIEAELRKIVKEKNPIDRQEITRPVGLELFAHEPYT
ncbi:threonine--tRNA ligase, partial [Enterococcus faecalis]